jgi:hypothetical protein
MGYDQLAAGILQNVAGLDRGYITRVAFFLKVSMVELLNQIM